MTSPPEEDQPSGKPRSAEEARELLSGLSEAGTSGTKPDGKSGTKPAGSAPAKAAAKPAPELQPASGTAPAPASGTDLDRADPVPVPEPAVVLPSVVVPAANASRPVSGPTGPDATTAGPVSGATASGSTKPNLAAPAGPNQAGTKTTKKKKKRKRGPGCLSWLLIALAVVLALLVAVLAGAFIYINRNLQHVDALPGYPGRIGDTPGENILLVGTDSRADLTEEEQEELHTGGSTEGARADTIIILHLPEDRKTGQVSMTSLPRDSLVTIPAFTDADGKSHPEGKNKINHTYYVGGPALLTQTVELETGIHLDHYVEIDFAGLAGIVDAMGGVYICLDKPIKDEKAGIDLEAGCQTLNGEEALGYARARYSDPMGDLGRVQRQQELIAAIIDQFFSKEVWLHPKTLKATVDATLDAIRVDKSIGTWDFAQIGRSLLAAPGNAVGATVPVANPGYNVPGVGSTVLWDEEEAARLFAAIAADEPIPEDLVNNAS